MTNAEGTGRTLGEATENALRALGVSRDEVDIEVLQEPRPALLGLGGREAKVRVSLRPTKGQMAGEILASMLQMIGYTAAVEIADEPDAIVARLQGQDASAIVGRHGQTLDALEFVAGSLLAKRLGGRVALRLDAGDYRVKREEVLVDMARRAADQAVRLGQPTPLAAMEARERRIVHLALKDDDRVTTISEGQEGRRHVVIVPAGARTPDTPAGSPDGVEGIGVDSSGDESDTDPE